MQYTNPDYSTILYGVPVYYQVPPHLRYYDNWELSSYSESRHSEFDFMVEWRSLKITIIKLDSKADAIFSVWSVVTKLTSVRPNLIYISLSIIIYEYLHIKIQIILEWIFCCRCCTIGNGIFCHLCRQLITYSNHHGASAL